MGNAGTKAEASAHISAGIEEKDLEKTSPDPPATGVTRKHSTISSARLFLGSEKIEYLTEDQKNLIRTSWKRIELDVARVGVITFIQ